MERNWQPHIFQAIIFMGEFLPTGLLVIIIPRGILVCNLWLKLGVQCYQSIWESMEEVPRNQTWVRWPEQKASLLGCREGNRSVCYRCQARRPAAGAQKTWTSQRLSGQFKDGARDGGCGVCDQLRDILLIGWWWYNWKSASSTFVPPGLVFMCWWAAYS